MRGPLDVLRRGVLSRDGNDCVPLRSLRARSVLQRPIVAPASALGAARDAASRLTAAPTPEQLGWLMVAWRGGTGSTSDDDDDDDDDDDKRTPHAHRLRRMLEWPLSDRERSVAATVVASSPPLARWLAADGRWSAALAAACVRRVVGDADAWLSAAGMTSCTLALAAALCDAGDDGALERALAGMTLSHPAMLIGGALALARALDAVLVQLAAPSTVAVALCGRVAALAADVRMHLASVLRDTPAADRACVQRAQRALAAAAAGEWRSPLTRAWFGGGAHAELALALGLAPVMIECTVVPAHDGGARVHASLTRHASQVAHALCVLCRAMPVLGAAADVWIQRVGAALVDALGVRASCAAIVRACELVDALCAPACGDSCACTRDDPFCGDARVPGFFARLLVAVSTAAGEGRTRTAARACLDALCTARESARKRLAWDVAEVHVAADRLALASAGD